jgi:Flp pilus assembly pilin Flp
VTKVTTRVLDWCRRLSASHDSLATSLRRESGQGLVEYSLVLLLVAAVVILALTAVGTSLLSALEEVGKKF